MGAMIMEDLPQKLFLFVDGGAEPTNPGTATSGLVFYDKNQNVIFEKGEVVQDGGPTATNNFGEYSALYLALEWLCNKKWNGELIVKADSKLLVEQVNNRWKCNLPHLQQLRKKIWELLEILNLQLEKNCKLSWISRKQNKRANDLCRIAYQKYKEKK